MLCQYNNVAVLIFLKNRKTLPEEGNTAKLPVENSIEICISYLDEIFVLSVIQSVHEKNY